MDYPTIVKSGSQPGTSPTDSRAGNRKSGIGNRTCSWVSDFCRCPGLFDVGEEAPIDPEGAPGPRLGGHLAARDLDRRGEGDSRGGQIDRVLRSHVQRRAEIELDACGRHLQHPARFFPPDLQLVLLGLQPRGGARRIRASPRTIGRRDRRILFPFSHDCLPARLTVCRGSSARLLPEPRQPPVPPRPSALVPTAPPSGLPRPLRRGTSPAGSPLLCPVSRAPNGRAPCPPVSTAGHNPCISPGAVAGREPEATSESGGWTSGTSGPRDRAVRGAAGRARVQPERPARERPAVLGGFGFPLHGLSMPFRLERRGSCPATSVRRAHS